MTEYGVNNVESFIARDGLSESLLAIAKVVENPSLTLVEAAKELKVTKASLLRSLSRIERKCPGFRKSIEELKRVWAEERKEESAVEREVREVAGLTKNQAAIAAAVVNPVLTLEEIAESFGIGAPALHRTLDRIELKCPGFRERLRALRFKEFPDAKDICLSKLDYSELSEKDLEKIEAMK